MIPVPASELELYDLDNAKLLYKQKAMNDTTAGYVKSALDYYALEARCDLFERKQNEVIEFLEILHFTIIVF